MVFGRFKKNDRTRELEALANAPVGAPATFEGRRCVIRGTVIMNESGDRWIEHLLEDGDGRRVWVSIENDRTTIATVWENLEVFDISGGPDDSQVVYQGERYRRKESGTVQFTATEGIDMDPTGTLDYVDFINGDGAKIGFERFGDKDSGRRSIAGGGTCPSCHAPLVSDSDGRCTSCGSSLTVDHGWFGSWEVAHGRDVTDSAGLQ